MDELEFRSNCYHGLEFFAKYCLKIRAKSGDIKPFFFNKAQAYMHERLEDQKARTGKVRAYILKGRQQGCSTYIGARYYHRVTNSIGKRVFILTHRKDATDNLFGMVDRYQTNNPIAPDTSADNKKELAFSDLDSGYKVGTAGNKAVGRSDTIQLFHGSEAAWWDNADIHRAGILQAVPDEPDTEIIFESTANGLGNFFHKGCMEALSGGSDYELIFIPWYWQEEYVTQPQSEFILDDNEQFLKENYNLSVEQLAWRRKKIHELGAEWIFKQEYPNTPEEAFQESNVDSFIPSQDVLKARKNKVNGYGPRLLGVDPARFGDDRTSFGIRQGRKVESIESWEKIDTMRTVGHAVRIYKEQRIDYIFVDVCGLGAGVYDRLIEIIPPQKVIAVNSSEKAIDQDRYFNKRAEIWGELKDFLSGAEPVELPDLESLQIDLTACSWKPDSKGRVQLESKDDIKKRGYRSPDEGDSVALTFARPMLAHSSGSLNYKAQGIV